MRGICRIPRAPLRLSPLHRGRARRDLHARAGVLRPSGCKSDLLWIELVEAASVSLAIARLRIHRKLSEPVGSRKAFRSEAAGITAVASPIREFRHAERKDAA